MLPEHIINKIMLYVSRPAADMHREYEGFGKKTHKLEKMLELKVVMNYLETQMGLYSHGKLLSSQDQRLQYIGRKFQEIQQYHPMFYHCNKNLIRTCLVMITANVKLDLKNYEELYDQFSHMMREREQRFDL